ncbi:MAG TPA: extracellular solute-binding protein [Ruminiclostridium sp.]
MKNKKVLKLVSLVLVGCLTFSLAACGETKTDSSTSTTVQESTATTTTDSSKEAVTIRLLSRWSGTDSSTPIWQAVQKQYMEKNPNVTIVDESIAEEGAYNNKFKAALATNDMPAVFAVNGTLLAVEYAKSGVLQDLTSYFEQDKAWSDGLNESNINVSKFDVYGVKGIYSIPAQNAIEVMYYNKDLFKKAGIEKTPETYDELLSDIEKLKTSGITPWGVGGKDTWRVGHIQNALLYKLTGVDKAIELGFKRTAKWTDADVVQSLKMLKDLKTMGAFQKDLEGINFEVEKANFLSGKSAMVFNGTWFMGDINTAGFQDNVGTFLFPYMKDKPQFKDHNITFPSGYSVSAKASDLQKEHAVGFLKMFTSKENQEKYVYETKNLPVRKDLQLDASKTGAMFAEVSGLASMIKFGGMDTFDKDPLASMQDRTRNSFIGMLLGNTPEVTAKEIQDEIDANK